MVAQPDPRYDLIAAFDRYAPGVVLTRAVLDALAAQYAANTYTPLTSDQVVAIAGPLPAYPTGLPRFADSNPVASDGWARFGASL